MEQKMMYGLTDEQSELLRFLLVERIKSQVKDLEEHQLNELDCFDNANLIEELCKTMKVLCKGDDYSVRIPAGKAKPEEEAVKAEEPPVKEKDPDGNKMFLTRGNKERSCKTCIHCEKTLNEGRGKTRYVCALSGADFAPGLVCDCYDRQSAEE